MNYGLTNNGNFYKPGQIKTPEFKFNFYDKDAYDMLAKAVSDFGNDVDDEMTKQEERQYKEEQIAKGRAERQKLIESLLKSKNELQDRQKVISDKLNNINQLNPELLYDGIDYEEDSYMV